MNPFKVKFDDLPWQHLRPDVRQKVRCEGSTQIRLVEFDTSDGSAEWCESGHIGYVLKGALSVSFDGTIVSYEAGDVMIIPSGAAARHRATSITQGTRLLMIEDA